MARSIGVFLSLTLLSVSAHATSTLAPKRTQVTAESSGYCEIEGRYQGEHAPTQTVYWKFTGTGARAVGAIDCQDLKDPFKIRIFGAKKSLRLGRIAYPDFVPTPKPGTLYRLQLNRFSRTDARGEPLVEWAVRNWDEGFARVNP